MSRPTSCLRPAVALVCGLLAAEGWAATLTVCPEPDDGCRYLGADGLQQAVDDAANGDHLLLRSGRYRGTRVHDVRFGELVIRGRVLVQDKTLTIAGEPGTELDLGVGQPASAIVVHRGVLTLAGVTVRDARPAEAEDNVYDGHGVFVVDGRATLTDVTFRGIGKMALSIRGDSAVQATGLRLLDGHVGVWIEEAASLTLSDCRMAGNDSAAVAAYVDARVTVSGCVLEANQDDGLYAAGRAVIEAADSLFLRNSPFALRAVEEARITVTGSTFYADAALANPEAGDAVRIRDSRHFAGDRAR